PGPTLLCKSSFGPGPGTGQAGDESLQPVRYQLDVPLDGHITVWYAHLGQVLKEEPLTGSSWSWSPPVTDFKGYLVYLYRTEDAGKSPIYSVAVDVSSDWTRFPRYGFVSGYGNLSPTAIGRQVEQFNRFHLNAVQ